MKITSYEIEEGDLGLKASKMAGLGQIVVLCGPNGSGKTRVLRTLRRHAERGLTMQQRDDYLAQLSELQRAATEFDPPGHLDANSQRRQDAITLALREPQVTLDTPLNGHDPLVFPYLSGDINFHNWKTKTPDHVERKFSAASKDVGISALGDYIPAVLREINVRHAVRQPLSDAGDKDTVELKETLLRIDNNINALLGSQLDWGLDGEPIWQQLQLQDENISAGQKLLIATGVALALQSESQTHSLIVLDEPENHLHPKAAIEAIDRIALAFPKTQIWISTHSVSIAAHFGEDSFWSVDNGKVSKGSRAITKTIASLLGGDRARAQLTRFIDIAIKVALAHFTSECFKPPMIADTKKGDPQTTLIREQIRAKIGDRPIRVLDYGAGRGRLLEELTAATEILDSVSLYLGDQENVPNDCQLVCRGRLATHYPLDHGQRYLLGDHSITAGLRDSKVDLVVLCNVVHELTPKAWQSVFGPAGVLDEILSADGHVLIVEDHELPTGEQAHEYHFLVLDNSELSSLFGVSGTGTIVTAPHWDESYRDRIKAHLVPRTALSNVSNSTIENCLRKLESNSLAKAREISRGSTPNSAMRFAFWTMQYFNASSALKDWNSSSRPTEQ